MTRVNSKDSQQSEIDYEIVTEANPTHRMVYVQHHLHFYNNCDKADHQIDHDTTEIDKALNSVFTNALVDSRQTNDDLNHQLVHLELAHQICENGPQVSLTTLDVLQKFTVNMQFGH